MTWSSFSSLLFAKHDAILGTVILQWIVIILTARLVAYVVRWLWQPGVVGEIIAGLLLGPSFCGWLFPDFWKAVFTPEAAPFFEVLKEIGLVLLLFLVGLEFEFGHLKQTGKGAVLIALLGIAVPFGLGLLLGPYIHEHVMGGKGDRFGVVLFMGTSMCITALPTLGRIMVDLNISKTKMAVVTITAAALGDVIGWIMLAGVTSAVRSELKWTTISMMAVYTAIFFVILLIVRPMAFRLMNKYFQKTNGELEQNGLALSIAVLFGCALVTHFIGIFAIFGAFLFGAVFSSHTKFREGFSTDVRSFVAAFFLPIFFTYTGLRTNIGGLSSVEDWLWCAVICTFAISGKWVTCMLVARTSGFNWKESNCIGVMMNTRALMELIVINVGKDLGVINDRLFTMLVLMAVLTTVMTTPLLILFHMGTELEAGIRSSSFFRKGK